MARISATPVEAFTRCGLTEDGRHVLVRCRLAERDSLVAFRTDELPALFRLLAGALKADVEPSS